MKHTVVWLTDNFQEGSIGLVLTVLWYYCSYYNYYDGDDLITSISATNCISNHEYIAGWLCMFWWDPVLVLYPAIALLPKHEVHDKSLEGRISCADIQHAMLFTPDASGKKSLQRQSTIRSFVNDPTASLSNCRLQCTVVSCSVVYMPLYTKTETDAAWSDHHLRMSTVTVQMV